MPRQNRVTPGGLIEAHPARGLLMGNRGILHDRDGRLGPARWRHRAWIACRLAFKDRRRPLMAPGRYTELFFCDEAVALAAGHRPCAECRRDDYRRFLAAWRRAYGLDASASLRAPALDAALHAARLEGRAQRRSVLAADDLPDGAFALLPDTGDDPWLVLGDRLRRWTHDGYAESRPRPRGVALPVLTPAPVVEALRHGYAPLLHPSADVP